MEEQIVRTIVDKPNSYEFGKAGNRFKIYFDTPLNLKKEIESLKALGLYQEELIC